MRSRCGVAVSASATVHDDVDDEAGDVDEDDEEEQKECAAACELFAVES